MALFVLATLDGTIIQFGSIGDDLFEAFSPPGLQKIQIAFTPASDALTFVAQHYVLNGHVVRRSPMPVVVDKTDMLADGIDVCTISGLPDPSIVTISGGISAGPMPVNDGSLEISCDYAGTITVKVSAPPAYLDWEVTLNAT